MFNFNISFWENPYFTLKYGYHSVELVCPYSETYLSWTSYRPTFVFRINRCLVKLAKISCIRLLFQICFKHESDLFKVRFREHSLYIYIYIHSIAKNKLQRIYFHSTTSRLSKLILAKNNWFKEKHTNFTSVK